MDDDSRDRCAPCDVPDFRACDGTCVVCTIRDCPFRAGHEYPVTCHCDDCLSFALEFPPITRVACGGTCYTCRRRQCDFLEGHTFPNPCLCDRHAWVAIAHPEAWAQPPLPSDSEQSQTDSACSEGSGSGDSMLVSPPGAPSPMETDHNY